MKEWERLEVADGQLVSDVCNRQVLERLLALTPALSHPMGEGELSPVNPLIWHVLGVERRGAFPPLLATHAHRMGEGLGVRATSRGRRCARAFSNDYFG